ncbi:ATP-binding protein [Saccharothrix sp. S26]|uniref:ATP-binding protein n=1 Tax=Saccharothrix sp. S26 TaxID=2907215 RepID=UPI001F20511C|nr:ATP-binding protein [Saccharothrix sp. S26]MCE6995513.1 ATP-binding protein [Saccharothrix sp. S26]
MPSLVRRWTAEALTDLTDDELDDCLLVVTELVSNAYDHGLPPCRLRLFRSLDPCFVRIEVDDASPDRPVLGHSRISDLRGRGIMIVDRLCKDWGVTSHADHKTVWAELTCASAGPLPGNG